MQHPKTFAASAHGRAPSSTSSDRAEIDLRVEPAIVRFVDASVTPVAARPSLTKRAMVRAFDVVVATAAIVTTAPAAALIAIAIELDSSGPVIYRSARIGADGSEFDALKFRTMRLGADRELDALLASDADRRHQFERHHKLVDDPRVTRVGRLLRRHSLDELPQLLNVLRGEMSVVGPRPKLPSETALYGDALATVLRVKPGCTGLWQTSGRSKLTVEERVVLDLRYATERTMRGDVAICAKTVSQMLRPHDAEAH